MSGDTFDREVWNTRERPLSTDNNQEASNVDRTIRDIIERIMLGRVSVASDFSQTLPITGFLGDSLKVRPTSPVGLSVRLSAGLGFFADATIATAIGGIASVDDLQRWKPLPLPAEMGPITIPAPDPTNPRVDIVEVRINRRLADSASRDVLNPVSGVFEPNSVSKTLAYDLDSFDNSVVSPAASTAAVSYKRGIPTASPAAAATTPGYVKIAEIQVGAAVASVDADKIKDLRHLLFPYDQPRVTAQILMPTSGGATPTLQSIAAPPGTIVVAVGVAPTSSAAEVNLYVVLGDTSPYLVNANANLKTADSSAAQRVIITPTVTTVDATIQSDIQGANASPAGIKVARDLGTTLGQPIFKVNLKATGADGVGAAGGLYSVHLSFARA